MYTGVLCVVSAYAIGSVLWGVVLGRWFRGTDLRKADNPGASGTVRQFGFGLGLAVGILDLAKGAVCVYGALALGLGLPWIAATAAAVVLGHNWPVWFEFRGGGGLATGAGAAAALAPVETAISIGVALLAALIYRLSPFYMRVPVTSLPMGSMFGAPALLWLTFSRGNLTAGYACLSMFVLVGLRGLVMLNEKH